MIVVAPTDGVIERWSLASFKKETGRSLPFQGIFKTMEMGYATDGPLLIVSAASSALLVPAVIFSEASFTIPTLASFGSLVGLALFSQTIGWILITTNLPHVVPSVAGLLLLLQPALAFVWDVLLFSRPTTLSNWTGVCIVLTAIYLGMSSSHTDTAQR